MERLTTKRKDGRCAIKNDDRATPLEQMNKIPLVIDRLAAYEDIGTPEEINRIIDAYGRGLTLRTDTGERLEIVKDIPTERLRELAEAEKDGRLVVLQEGATVRRLQEEYRKAKHMVNERLQSPDCTTGRIGGFGEGVIHVLDKILTRDEAEAVLKKEGADNEAD